MYKIIKKNNRTHAGQKNLEVLYETQIDENIAMYLFGNMYYHKLLNFDDCLYISEPQYQILFQKPEETFMNKIEINDLIEKYFSKEIKIIEKKKNFNVSLLGKQLLKLHLIPFWIKEYQKITKPYKDRSDLLLRVYENSQSKKLDSIENDITLNILTPLNKHKI